MNRAEMESIAKRHAEALRKAHPYSGFMAALADAIELSGVLQGENVELSQQAQSPPMLRHLVRSTFATLEGMAYSLKRVCLAGIGELAVNFTPEEIAMLRERTYDLAENGEIRERDARLRTFANLQFAQRMFARSLGVAPPPPIPSDVRQAIERAVKTRDRLMHPKGLVSLAVAPSEIADMTAAIQWFFGLSNRAIATPHFKFEPAFVLRYHIDQSGNV